MYKQIEANKTKTVALIALFLVFITGLGWVLSYVYDNPLILWVAAAVSIVQAWVSYYYSDKVALAVSGAQKLEGNERREVQRIVENLAITAGVPMPELYIIDDTAPNAFATGRDPQHASIAVTRGLLDKLDRTELEGVLAHEMSHITNYDIRLTTVVVILVGIIALASDWFMRSLWWGGHRRRDDDNQGNGSGYLMLIGIVLAILAPLAATLIQLAISRKREFLADASGALLTRYPEGLASALEKIAADKEPLEVANKATAHLYFENPLKDYSGKINALFSTHPPVEERIKALRSML
ncbi:MAG TPA: zinc metalloprotease HtpX [Patescibacteria group bacterium]